jgi:hypothetical protein
VHDNQPDHHRQGRRGLHDRVQGAVAKRAVLTGPTIHNGGAIFKGSVVLKRVIGVSGPWTPLDWQRWNVLDRGAC